MSIGALSMRYLGGLLGPPRNSQTGGTAIASPVIPFQGGAPLASGVKAKGYTHLTTVCYTTGATAHTLFVLRPLNFTTFSANAAAGQAVVNLTANPGNYSTTYQYPGSPLATANHGIAASDYVMYQAADGTWVLDTVASVSTLAITMTTNLPTGGVLLGGLFYYFGTSALNDPATGQVQPSTLIAASQTRDKTWSDSTAGIVTSLHPGDPLILFSANGTNGGALEFLAGYYSEV